MFLRRIRESRAINWPTTRRLLLILALVLLLPVFLRPSLPTRQPARSYLIVVDITQSMNVRDYFVDDQPQSRLAHVKHSLARSIAALPCGSRIGLGLFTGWQVAALAEPIGVCRNRSELLSIVRHMDWRMTWAPQSNVARGLVNALYLARVPDTALVFITDGDEAPASEARGDPFAGSPRASGLLVGAGDVRPSAIPKLATGGRMKGYFKQDGSTLFSALAEGYLQRLAQQSGLDYHRLNDGEGLIDLLRSGRYATRTPAERPISWVFAALSLGLLTAVYGVLPWLAARRSRGTVALLPRLSQN